MSKTLLEKSLRTLPLTIERVFYNACQQATIGDE
jgi:hypothetical protein